MAKKKQKLKGLSSSNGGNLYFTLESLGNNNFHLKISKRGQLYLIHGHTGDVPNKFNEDDFLKTLFELIDFTIFKGNFEISHYPINIDHDIPF